MKNKFIVLMISMMMISCASVKKAELASSEPDLAFIEVEELRTDAMNNQADLYAQNSFLKGESEYREAIKNWGDGKEDSDVMDELAMAKAYYNKSMNESTKAINRPERIVFARKEAINAGVYDASKLREELHDLDSELADTTNNFNEDLDNEEFTRFLKDYQNIEIRAVQHYELSEVRNRIDWSQKKSADDLATETFKTAMRDLKAAENMIAQNPRKPDEYIAEVDRARFSSKLLQDVMQKLTGIAEGSSEKVALELVKKDRDLGKLNNRIEYLDDRLEVSHAATGALVSRIEFQNELEAVIGEYPDEMAEVYQQGDKLILRLKDMNFAVGSAKVPQESKDLLRKVDKTIEKLNASYLIVQGHTDSTGSSSINKKLSKKRAVTIANYLRETGKNDIGIEVEAMGETQPIASNSTKKGRAQNRRVDIIINAAPKMSNRTVYQQ
ncbi:MAG: hypothetical protein CME65_02750 [Halobacteriovoraceae bacterium]|nr:hypothetical protein [Halobacteriovoraceae bacterium]|tara:strand:- start:12497 stop:13822 length:1326 start_codon:yes stop_codon:yes gene_type:complete